MAADYDVANCVEIGHPVCVVDASAENSRTVCLIDDDVALGGRSEVIVVPEQGEPLPPDEPVE